MRSVLYIVSLVIIHLWLYDKNNSGTYGIQANLHNCHKKKALNAYLKEVFAFNSRISKPR